MGVRHKHIFYIFVACFFKCQNVFILAISFDEINKKVKQT